jgi:hypothetical protein
LILFWWAIAVLVKSSVLSAVACAVATTSLQPKPTAEPKTVVSVKSLGSRSSRAGVSSSYNLKLFL